MLKIVLSLFNFMFKEICDRQVNKDNKSLPGFKTINSRSVKISWFVQKGQWLTFIDPFLHSYKNTVSNLFSSSPTAGGNILSGECADVAVRIPKGTSTGHFSRKIIVFVNISLLHLDISESSLVFLGAERSDRNPQGLCRGTT